MSSSIINTMTGVNIRSINNELERLYHQYGSIMTRIGGVQKYSTQVRKIQDEQGVTLPYDKGDLVFRNGIDKFQYLMENREDVAKSLGKTAEDIWKNRRDLSFVQQCLQAMENKYDLGNANDPLQMFISKHNDNVSQLDCIPDWTDYVITEDWLDKICQRALTGDTAIIDSEKDQFTNDSRLDFLADAVDMEMKSHEVALHGEELKIDFNKFLDNGASAYKDAFNRLNSFWSLDYGFYEMFKPMDETSERYIRVKLSTSGDMEVSGVLAMSDLMHVKWEHGSPAYLRSLDTGNERYYLRLQFPFNDERSVIWWKLSEPELFQLPDNEDEDVDVIDPYVPREEQEEEEEGEGNEEEEAGEQSQDSEQEDEGGEDDYDNLTLEERAILIESQIEAKKASGKDAELPTENEVQDVLQRKGIVDSLTMANSSGESSSGETPGPDAPPSPFSKITTLTFDATLGKFRPLKPGEKRKKTVTYEIKYGSTDLNNPTHLVPQLEGYKFNGFFSRPEKGIKVFDEQLMYVGGTSYWTEDGRWRKREASVTVYAQWELLEGWGLRYYKPYELERMLRWFGSDHIPRLDAKTCFKTMCCIPEVSDDPYSDDFHENANNLGNIDLAKAKIDESTSQTLLTHAIKSTIDLIDDEEGIQNVRFVVSGHQQTANLSFRVWGKSEKRPTQEINHYVHTIQFLVDSYIAVKKLCLLFEMLMKMYGRLEGAWLSDKLANPYGVSMLDQDWTRISSQLERMLGIEWQEDDDGYQHATALTPSDIDLVRFRQIDLEAILLGIQEQEQTRRDFILDDPERKDWFNQDLQDYLDEKGGDELLDKTSLTMADKVYLKSEMVRIQSISSVSEKMFSFDDITVEELSTRIATFNTLLPRLPTDTYAQKVNSRHIFLDWKTFVDKAIEKFLDPSNRKLFTKSDVPVGTTVQYFWGTGTDGKPHKYIEYYRDEELTVPLVDYSYMYDEDGERKVDEDGNLMYDRWDFWSEADFI